MKRLCSACLILAMLATMLPVSVLAAEEDHAISITASGSENDTITVSEPSVSTPGTGGGTVYGETLGLSAAVSKPLDRDYDQAIQIQVTNLSNQPLNYYLVCENSYSDIYMNFVKSGSEYAPLTIQPNETQEIELSIFAQNARHTRYTVDILGVVTGGETVEMPLTFSCAAADGTVEFQTGTVDENTLATLYTVTNSGSTAISDLTLAVTGEAADYVRINPSVENYALGAGQSVQVKLIPDLFKMKENSKSVISGTLSAEGGGTGSTEISFDTQGKEITATTIGELALMQDDNPYHDIEFDEDTFSFVTNNGTSDQNLADITAKYWDEDDPEKDGVNTAEEFMEVIGTLFDENGMIDFTISDTLVYNGGTETIPVCVQVSSELVEPDRRMRSNVQEVGTTYDSSTNEMTTTYKIYMTMEEYRKYVENLGNASEYLEISDLPENILGEPDSIHGQVAVTVRSSISSAAFDFLDDYVTDPSQFVDFSQIDDVQNFADKFTVVSDFAAATKPLKTLGTVSNVIGTGVDVYDTVSLWTNPDPSISTSDKVAYTSLQVAKNFNTYVGGTLLAKGGAGIGTAVADGPGAIIGYFAGHVISGLIGFGLEKWVENMEEDMYGGAIYYDIYGRQCTNAGKVTSNFYLPDINTSTVGIYETGRMYDGSPYNGNAHYAEDQFGGDQYIHDRPVNYDYILNGNKVGNTQNNGLTSVSIVDLSNGAEYLKPGNNTIVRDYDTNAGHYSVVADTEITILYPSDTPISYIGSPDTMEEVRLLPDFAVYWENILPAHTAIIGESNTVSVNLYNRGSMGGWVDVTVTAGGSAVYEAENLYMAAFSEQTISFDWTPSGESADLTVTLENKCVGVEERKSDNNTASRTITARNRQVPSIGEIMPTEAVQDDVIYLSAELTQTLDVVSVAFQVDDEAPLAASLTGTGSNSAQASVGVSDLNAGTHTIQVIVTYYTGPDQTESVSSEGTFTVTAPGSVSFTIDETVREPNFTVLQKRNGQFRTITAQISQTDQGWTLNKTADMADAPESYFLLTKCDGGVILMPLSQLENAQLSLSNGKTVTIQAETDVELGSVYLEALDGTELNRSIRLSLQESTISVQGADKVELWAQYTVDGMGSSATEEVDLSSSSATINLADYYRLYRLTLPDAPEELDYIDSLIYVEKESRLYELYGDTRYSRDSKQLSILIDGSYLNRLQDASAVTAYIPCEDTLYVADLLNYAAPITLNRDAYRSITFACSASAWEIQRISLQVGYNTVELYGETIYVPAGSYDMFVSYTAGGQQLYYTEAVNIDQNTQILLPGPVENPSTLTVTWPEWMAEEQAVLDYSVHTSNNYWYGYAQLKRGEPLSLPTGITDVDLTLEQDDDQGEYRYTLSLSLNMAIEEGKNLQLPVGNSFTGTIYQNNHGLYEPGAFCRLYFDSLQDAYGNLFNNYSANRSDDAMRGTVTLTSAAGETYKISVTETWLSRSISFRLPNDIPAGDYTYAISLSNSVQEEEVQPGTQHSIIASAGNGGSITPSGEVTVSHGGNQNFEIQADNGWAIQEVLVDGVSQGAVSSYTFYNVTKNHTITVRFREQSGGSSYSDDSSTSGSRQDIDVTDASNGTVTLSPESAYRGEQVIITATPDAGYGLESITVTDNRGNAVEVTLRGDGRYSFIMPAGSVTVEAQFVPTIGSAGVPFTDVAQGTWYYDAVAYCYENGIMDGTGGGLFQPDMTTSRGMIVTMLYSMEDRPEVGDSTFPDIAAGQWYADAVTWAAANQIAGGYESGNFGPNDPITREQLVTILYRYAQYKGYDLSAQADPTHYTDTAQISSWALTAMQWAVANGLVSGTGANTLSPAGNATRAQVATILMRFCEMN